MDEIKVGGVSFSPRVYEWLYKTLPDTGVYTKPVFNPDPAIEYLRSLEWSMGSGQCPSCYGLSPEVTSFGGHHSNCNLAHALLCLHQKVDFQ